jgi:hypothetical protein
MTLETEGVTHGQAAKQDMLWMFSSCLLTTAKDSSTG